MSKKDILSLFTVAALVAILAAVVVLLIFSIATLRRVTHLDRFFAAMNEDYLSIIDGSPAEGAQDEPVCVPGDPDTTDQPFIGDPAAPVVMVEYSDFECPFCGRFFVETYPLIKERYIDNGLVRLYFKDFPLEDVHSLARPAAMAGQCIFRRYGAEAFFAFRNRMFDGQSKLRGAEDVDRLALQSGLTEEELKACYNDQSITEAVNADLAEADALGITATPSFVINGMLIVGAVPFSEFQRAIDEALAGEVCR